MYTSMPGMAEVVGMNQGGGKTSGDIGMIIIRRTPKKVSCFQPTGLDYNQRMSSPISRDEELNILIRAKYPILYIVSWEERRIENLLLTVAEQRRKKLYSWTLTRGMLPLDGYSSNASDPATCN